MPKYIKSTLSDGEEIKGAFKYHWFVTFKIVTYYLVSFCFFVVPPVAVLLFIYAIYYHLSMRKSEFAVTNKRVIMKKGIISIDTEEMRNSKVESIEIKQSALGRILGYGEIEVTGTGISKVIFKFLYNPKGVKRQMESAIF